MIKVTYAAGHSQYYVNLSELMADIRTAAMMEDIAFETASFEVGGQTGGLAFVQSLYQAEKSREQFRHKIEPLAGDTQSIQGTIADNVGLLLEEVGKLATAISISSSIDPAVKAAAQPLADGLAPLLTGITDGSIKLTHHVKSTGTVVADAGTRATAVATALENNAAP